MEKQSFLPTVVSLLFFILKLLVKSCLTAPFYSYGSHELLNMAYVLYILKASVTQILQIFQIYTHSYSGNEQEDVSTGHQCDNYQKYLDFNFSLLVLCMNFTNKVNFRFG